MYLIDDSDHGSIGIGGCSRWRLAVVSKTMLLPLTQPDRQESLYCKVIESRALKEVWAGGYRHNVCVEV